MTGNRPPSIHSPRHIDICTEFIAGRAGAFLRSAVPCIPTAASSIGCPCPAPRSYPLLQLCKKQQPGCGCIPAPPRHLPSLLLIPPADQLTQASACHGVRAP